MSFTDFLNNMLHGESKVMQLFSNPGRALGQGYANLFAGPEVISGNAMPVPNYEPPQPQPTNFGNPFGFDEGNSTDDILKQLQALSDPSRYMMNQDQLRQQAMAQASAQYDPQIAALRAAMSGAQTRGERNKQSVIGMFNGLSDNLRGEVPVVRQQYDQAKQTTGQEYNDLKNSINQQYDQSQKQQEDLYKRLNIQAAATDVVPQQQTDRNFFVGQAGAKNQTAQNALTTEQQGAVDYTERGVQNARTEGTQRGADIMNQLADLMNQYQAQIGAQEAAKQSSVAAILGQLQTSAQKQALDMSQRDFQNYIAAANLGRGLHQDQLNELKMQQGLYPQSVKSLSDIPQRALGMGLGQDEATALSNVFGAALSSPDILSSVDPNTGQQLSAEAKAARIVEQGRQQGMTPQELNALMSMALEYFGRR
jgi:hypothetical protein